MVKEIQTIDEYYDEDDDELSFYPPSYFKYDEQLVLIAILMLLEQRYRLMLSMTPQDIVDEIDDIMDSFESEIKSTTITKVDNAVWDAHLKELIEWNIPIMGYVDQDTSMYPIIKDGLTGMVNQLRDDLKTKARFFAENMKDEDFSILPNFRRAIKRINDNVGNNLIYAKEKSHRKVLKFVYGEDKLYKWYHMNDSRVCDWCIAQGNEPPRRIDEWEYDHPHGRCILEPIDGTYSSEYYALLI